MRSSNQRIYDIICGNQGHTLKDKLGAGARKIIICGYRSHTAKSRYKNQPRRKEKDDERRQPKS